MSAMNFVEAILVRGESRACKAAQKLAMRQPAAMGGLLLVAMLLLGAASGCVERTVKIQSDPPGALVTVNDEEVGATPVKFAFLWYGDYEIVLRKTGYETLKTHCEIKRPWYEYPPFDLVAETLVPKVIQDSHTLPTYTLAPAEAPAVADVVERASELREQTVGE